MGRHFEVRAAAMAGTAAKKSALNLRASKEIYLAAKSGDNPTSNLALKGAIDKYKGQGVPRDVIERAIKKAGGSEAVAYIPGRYEIKGPGNSQIVVDTLTDNVNRAIAEINTAVKRTHATLTKVAYNFTEVGLFAFTFSDEEQLEEALVLADIDVSDLTREEDVVQLLVNPSDFAKTRVTLNELGIEEFKISEIRMIANETITLDGEEKEVFLRLVNHLEEIEDVQEVYHNVEL